MYLTQRKWHHVPAQFQGLTAFAIITILAFSVGWAAGAYGSAAYSFLTTDRNPAPVAAPVSGLRIPNSVAHAPVAAPASGLRIPNSVAHAPVAAAASGLRIPNSVAHAPVAVVNNQALFIHIKAGQARVSDIPVVPAVAADPAQQGVMNYVRAHNAIEGQQGSR